jgi:hypothetical protein
MGALMLRTLQFVLADPIAVCNMRLLAADAGVCLSCFITYACCGEKHGITKISHNCSLGSIVKVAF